LFEEEFIAKLIDGAHGPDGFRACFYQEYREVIKKDVVNVVLKFFTIGWLLPSFISNTNILIPKSNIVDTIDQFKAITLANFKFKIISKILADRLASVLPNIVSQEKKGFVKGRNIKDYIALTSQEINLLDKKSFGCNLAIKIFISKAFDTLTGNS